MKSPGRIVSMDQLRGYAVAAMVFVNYVGRFDATPWMLKHHRVGMSFNDTVAPLFMFVVGMGFRLSMMRRMAVEGTWRARRHAVVRYASLTLIGFVVYAGYFWDALSDIGLAGLLALWFVDKPARIRVAAACGYLAIYQTAYLAGYCRWDLLNGGPLGPLSWVFMLLMGTVAYDLLATRDRARIVHGCILWTALLCGAGWALKLPWAHLKPEWPFTQYGMSAPYPLYATGLCFLTLLAFYLLCDVRRMQLPHLTVIGKNALVLYGAHWLLLWAGMLILPDSAPWTAIIPGFAATYVILYAFAAWMNRKNILVKL